MVFLANVVRSLRSGEPAGDNPWNAWTLEWATTSPPPHDNFTKVPPVRGRRPLWDLAEGKAKGALAAIKMPDKNVVAMWTFIASEAGFFLILIITYVFFNGTTRAGATLLDVKQTGIFTVALLSSSVTLWLSERALASGNSTMFRGWLLATIVLGAIFIAGQGSEYQKLFSQGLNVNTSLFASTFFTLTGFHGLHVTLGLLALGVLFAVAIAGDMKGKHSSALKAVGLYWHFVDVVWIAVFSVVYLRNVL
jgi:cytochrome c oxidase subunit 1/cytochrome c oxidase subunit I+III